MKKLNRFVAASAVLVGSTAHAAIRYFNMADRAIATLKIPGEPDWMVTYCGITLALT